MDHVFVCSARFVVYNVRNHGEACSHIAALLFKFEAIGRLGQNSDSKTSEACTWNRSYRKKVTPTQIVDMDFTKPKHGKYAKL
ncbi:hypothetical protein DPMN_182780 [Dreissena polymorpha]|uniref:SWIM-type domain-containing protein n=1 Tax=Dreissena polymorpha TaxID=45954 RepID=A0A9D4DIR7_DREPO|nr:hypothetical protein DPMN_182780 [Dreissena polymorpha]